MDKWGVNYLAKCISELQNEASEALYDTKRLEILERRENLLQALLWELKKNDSNSNMGGCIDSVLDSSLPGRAIGASRMANMLGFKE